MPGVAKMLIKNFFCVSLLHVSTLLCISCDVHAKLFICLFWIQKLCIYDVFLVLVYIAIFLKKKSYIKDILNMYFYCYA